MRSFIILTALLFFCHCSRTENNEKIPAGTLTPAKMQEFLYDIHSAEAKVMVSGIRQDSASALFHHMELQIMKKHKLDTSLVNRSLDFYNRHPELLDSVYAGLLKRTQK